MKKSFWLRDIGDTRISFSQSYAGFCWHVVQKRDPRTRRWSVRHMLLTLTGNISSLHPRKRRSFEETVFESIKRCFGSDYGPFTFAYTDEREVFVEGGVYAVWQVIEFHQIED